jgi:hypothetical protein
MKLNLNPTQTLKSFLKCVINSPENYFKSTCDKNFVQSSIGQTIRRGGLIWSLYIALSRIYILHCTIWTGLVTPMRLFLKQLLDVCEKIIRDNFQWVDTMTETRPICKSSREKVRVKKSFGWYSNWQYIIWPVWCGFHVTR